MCEYFLLIPIDVPSFKLIEGQIKELQRVVSNTPPRAENDQKSPGRIGLKAKSSIHQFEIQTHDIGSASPITTDTVDRSPTWPWINFLLNPSNTLKR